MPDPTPERDWVDKQLDDPEFRKGFFEEQAKLHREDIRAAVAAERERCVVAIYNDHRIPGEFQIRARDAIRREAENEDTRSHYQKIADGAAALEKEINDAKG